MWRLQTSVFAATADQSIFAWQADDHDEVFSPPPEYRVYQGNLLRSGSFDLFSPSLELFGSRESVVRISDQKMLRLYNRLQPPPAWTTIPQSETWRVDWEQSSYVHGIRIQLLVATYDHCRPLRSAHRQPWSGVCILPCYVSDRGGKQRGPLVFDARITEPGRIERPPNSRLRVLGEVEALAIGILQQSDFYFTPPVMKHLDYKSLDCIKRQRLSLGNIQVLMDDRSVLIGGMVSNNAPHQHGILKRICCPASPASPSDGIIYRPGSSSRATGGFAVSFDQARVITVASGQELGLVFIRLTHLNLVGAKCRMTGSNVIEEMKKELTLRLDDNHTILLTHWAASYEREDPTFVHVTLRMLKGAAGSSTGIDAIPTPDLIGPVARPSLLKRHPDDKLWGKDFFRD